MLQNASPGVELAERADGNTGRLIELVRPTSGAGRASLFFPDAQWMTLEQRWRDPAEAPDFETRCFIYLSDHLLESPPSKGGEERGRVHFMSFASVRVIYAITPLRRPPRGLCLVLPSAAGMTDVESVMQQLASRGWTVVMFGSPDPLLAERVRTHLAIDHEHAPADLGRLFGEETIDVAYAARLVVQTLADREPAFRSLPLTLVGVSLGALQLPACAALLEQSEPAVPRPTAAVLIAGGCGIDTVMLDGEFGREWLETVGARLPSTVDDTGWRAEFCDGCWLAPERCLFALHGVPVLLVDASFDAIVPPRCAEALWTALGRPERWTYPTGHVGLLAMLGPEPWRDVARWIDRQADARSTTAANTMRP